MAYSWGRRIRVARTPGVPDTYSVSTGDSPAGVCRGYVNEGLLAVGVQVEWETRTGVRSYLVTLALRANWHG